MVFWTGRNEKLAQNVSTSPDDDKWANALACRRKKWPFHLTQIAIIKIVGIHIVNVILVNALKKNLAGILNKIVV